MTEPVASADDPTSLSVSPAAVALASGANADPALVAEVRSVLREQAELLRLQKEQIRQEAGLHRWLLRFQHLSAGMKVVFEIALGIVGMAVVVVIVAAVWAATNDNGLVIESFSVPSDLVARGLTGQVFATHLLDHLSDLQARTVSLRRGTTYTNDWGNNIKVEIPTTGISINEVQRLLNTWLGRETRISGEVYRSQMGLAVAVRVGSAPATTFNGTDAGLDSLIQLAAVEVFKQTQPFRYATYLVFNGRALEAEPLLAKLATTSGDRLERAWAYTGWANALRVHNLDFRGSVEKATSAIGQDPHLPLAYVVRSEAETLLGHAEAAFRDNREAVALNVSYARRYYDPDHVAWTFPLTQRDLDESLGDFRKAAEDGARGAALRSPTNDAFPVAIDLIRDHDISAARAMLPSMQVIMSGAMSKDGALFFIALEMRDWPTAIAQAGRYAQPLESRQHHGFVSDNIHSFLAYALARAGRLVEAQNLVATTPLDCYDCVRERGNVAAVARNWRTAARWFAEAVRQGPSLPFAFLDWGAMLMQHGDYNGAIAKFMLANQKGPHFADPLEMWGEALMLMNRSDLALAKFEDADKYAPHWGRLHMKWGEALGYVGRKSEARAQYRIASTLDLSVADKAELGRDMRG